MRIRRRDDVPEDALLDRATITLTFVGTWAAITLLYYVNRAFAGGQLQTMLLACGVCVGTVLAVALRTDEFKALWHPKTGSTWRATLSDKTRLVPVGVFVGLCFASLLLTTGPIAATRSLVDPPAVDGYTTEELPQLIAAVDAAERFTSDKGGDLTYLVESFNYVQLVTHVPSGALLYGYPYSIIQSSAQAQVARIECRYLHDHRSR